MKTETVMRRIAKECREQIRHSEQQLAAPYRTTKRGHRHNYGPGWLGEHRGTIATCKEVLATIRNLRRQARRADKKAGERIWKTLRTSNPPHRPRYR